jgi:hypothetical protein
MWQNLLSALGRKRTESGLSVHLLLTLRELSAYFLLVLALVGALAIGASI